MKQTDKNKNIDIQVVKSNYLWFNVNDADTKSNQDNDISFNFDYEKLAGKIWRFYIDITLKLQNIDNMVRTAFQFIDEELNWDDIFIPDMITPMVNTAVQKCQGAFIQLCKSNKIPIDENIEIGEEIILSISNAIIEQYSGHRKLSDKQNEYLLNNTGLVIEPGYEVIVTIQCVFMIIDEFLFNQQPTHKIHNHKTFGEIVPIPRYITIKMNSLEIEKQTVELSFYDTIMFYQCLDCALQLLLGDKAPGLIATLEKRGLNQEVQDIFFKNGTILFKQLREMLESSNARFINLETQRDWNNLLH